MKISSAGCCLTDFLYRNVSYDSPVFTSYLSRKSADGGLNPGGLVFADDLERFAGKPFADVISELTFSAEPDAVALGGPAAVALVNAVQILRAPGILPDGRGLEAAFYGALGNDEVGNRTRGFLAAFGIRGVFRTVEGVPSSSTVVLADPEAGGGRGERTFVNAMGASGLYAPEDLPEEFFDADVVLFGGTALVPRIHDGLAGLLDTAKRRGAVTVVGTVYDFRNEKRSPGKCWPLGNCDRYDDIDLLVTDAHEALKISGGADLDEAVRILTDRGAGAVVVTDGTKGVRARSGGRLFAPLEPSVFPVCADVISLLRDDPSRAGDTTGCGDNFLGGLVASLALQTTGTRGGTAEPGRPQVSGGKPDLREAIAWGNASGGFACFYTGGTYVESETGDKVRKLLPLVDSCRRAAGL